MRLKTVRALTAALAVLVAAPTIPATASEKDTGRIEYTLGDTAFKVPGFLNADRTAEAEIELTGVVRHPRHFTGRRPVVMLAHGLWYSCAGETMGWPCPAGTAPTRSYLGYDYLAESLAEQGFVVVSVSVNGINAGELGQPADMARGALVNEHLEMLRDADAGRGPLARPLRVLRNRLDLTNVGLVGHSRGGRGVVWQAADIHAGDLPRGVRLRAVVPIAPADYYAPDAESPENLKYRITRIPFAVLAGDCDGGAAMNHRTFARNAAGHNLVPFHEVDLAGANHNFFNSEWAYDNDSGCAPEDTWTEREQQDVTVRYISSFLRLHMLGDTSAEQLVVNGFPGVEVTTHRPIG
ncbi:pimeloyl-ACP methyl ester carboxylesterase [Saccharothrix coeruleofusca]|uniref:alpha/beta hydrolase family protein n=1 Tax=Saccharothrix coeruleofusca TaxID=33919 RepID=UPI001AE1C87D|nr:hypothetical protein [Saccharothrix coeruleofusca]MBP2338861.1 pimeloyl-ACP methyl ester carboxylesterase [Saccharothrix coeruleofusca]